MSKKVTHRKAESHTVREKGRVRDMGRHPKKGLKRTGTCLRTTRNRDAFSIMESGGVWRRFE